MAQWKNLQRIEKLESSADREIRRSDTIVHTCEKFEGLHPAEPGLTAGRKNLGKAVHFKSLL